MTTMKLTALSEADIQKLHQQSLDVLEKVGIKITHDEALKKLKKAGAQVSEQTQIAKFPPELVRELLALAPSVAPLSGINGKLLNAGGGNRYYTSLILDPFINDFSDGGHLYDMTATDTLLGVDKATGIATPDASQYITGVNILVDGGYTAK